MCIRDSFAIYAGYAAFSTFREDVASATPIRFFARTGSSPTLIGSTAAFAPLPGGTATAASLAQPNTLYRGTLTVTRTAAGNTVAYRVVRLGDGATIMSHTAEDVGASATAFDTVGFYLARSSVSFDFFLSAVDVERTVVP